MHSYTHAIMGITDPVPGENIPRDYKNVNVEALRNEVDGFKRVLRELKINVIEMETRGNYREKLMMEDLAVVCQGTAILPKQLSSTAVTSNYNLLVETLNQCGIDVIKQDQHSTAKLSPSDVLFTGREFFVGMSDFTNETGASIIAETFPEFPCTPIKLPQRAFTLKRYVTVAGNDVLSFCDDDIGRQLIKKIEREASFVYQTLTIPVLKAANCVYVNNTLMHKGIEDIGNDCFKVFCDKIDFPRRSLKFTELNKLMLEPSSASHQMEQVPPPNRKVIYMIGLRPFLSQ